MKYDLPLRKHPRLKGYDYNNGAYFITLCIKNGHEILGQIVGRGIPDAPYAIELTEYGKNLCNVIIFINKKFNNITINKYVIMPNHVHMIVFVEKNGNIDMKNTGAFRKPRPTNAMIPKLISSIKRYTNKSAGFKMWQNNYNDRIIRNENEYQNIWNYIENNPEKLIENKL